MDGEHVRTRAFGIFNLQNLRTSHGLPCSSRGGVSLFLHGVNGGVSRAQSGGVGGLPPFGGVERRVRAHTLLLPLAL